MSEPESDHPELTPAQDEAVRRRLEAARYTEPLPDAVAERFDRVLVGLADERKPGRVTAPVVDLAAHRRRRAVQLLVAASAVVAVGFGLGQLSGYGRGDSADTASTSEQFARGGNDSQEHSPETQDEPIAPTLPSGEALASLPKIRPDHFRADVADPSALLYGTDANKAEAPWAVCRTPAKGERMLAVAYGGVLATLIYHAPSDHVRRVDLYLCDPPAFVRSAAIPDP